MLYQENPHVERCRGWDPTLQCLWDKVGHINTTGSFKNTYMTLFKISPWQHKLDTVSRVFHCNLALSCGGWGGCNIKREFYTEKYKYPRSFSISNCALTLLWLIAHFGLQSCKRETTYSCMYLEVTNRFHRCTEVNCFYRT